MIRICFAVTIYTTYRCFLKEFANYLHETGQYDISLICNREEGIREDCQDFVHLHEITMKRGISLTGFQSVLALKKIFRKERFDIVQYSTPNASLYASLAAKWAGIPVRLYCQWGIRYMGFTGWKESLFRTLEKIACRNSTFIEAESFNILDFARSEKLYDAARSCVIGKGSACGVNLTKFDIGKKAVWRKEIREKFGIPPEETVFAFAGRLTADKGVNELLKAFLDLSGERKDLTLIVCGGMDDRGSLDPALLKKAQENPKVIFPGNVPDAERYYSAADVFVAPSYREGFGLVVIEAEAMGLPAIVSDVPGQTDAILPEKTGMLFQVRNADSLREAMDRLAGDAGLREKLGRQAAEWVEKEFEQTKIFRQLREHREELTRHA